MSYPSAGPAPGNWLVPAIVSLLCCWPLAIPAIVFATRVNNQWAAGDYRGAEESAAKAKQFTIIAIILGVVVSIISFIVNMSMSPATI